MSICDLASRATQGLTSGTGGSIVGSVANVLSVLGTADIGIQLGTGGQAGLFDLPGLLNQAGIECANPDTGEVTLVSPAQWYGNGMSCDGLRNPDSDRIRKELEDFERREQLRNNIKQQTGINVNGHSQEILKEIDKIGSNIAGGFGNNGGGLQFDYDGILKSTLFTFSYDSIVSINSGIPHHFKQIYSSPELPQPDRIISQGQRTMANSVQSSTVVDYFEGIIIVTGVSGFIGFGFVNGVADALTTRSVSIEENKPHRGTLTGGWTKSSIRVRSGKKEIIFEPSNVPPPGAYIITNIGPPQQRDPTDPCNDGKRKKDPMPCSQCKLTPDLIKKIYELHAATGTARLISGQLYNPEGQIQGWGRQLYGASGMAGGGVRCSTLLDYISATATPEYYRLGLQRLPAFVPESLVNKSDLPSEVAALKTKVLADVTSFLEWMILTLEELIGQFPIPFEVTDEGKTNKVKVWNIAEALGELYGMQVKIVEDADQGVQWGVRAATEASKSGNAAVKTLHLLNEISDFLGAIKSQGLKEIDCTFTPDGLNLQTTEEMLKPSKQTLMVTNIEDGRSLLGLLLNINYWSQVAGRANFQTLKNNPATGQPLMPGDVIKEEKKNNRGFNKKFDEWRRKRQQPSAEIPNDQRPRGHTIPDIKVIEVPNR